mmetsp:Transcript_50098/g.74392  ORF Transcript_50098/g.74392 Transcript_50098/m.74392 type:complete len:150 (-) Transcript_50098:15-464(-)
MDQQQPSTIASPTSVKLTIPMMSDEISDKKMQVCTTLEASPAVLGEKTSNSTQTAINTKADDHDNKKKNDDGPVSVTSTSTSTTASSLTTASTDAPVPTTMEGVVVPPDSTTKGDKSSSGDGKGKSGGGSRGKNQDRKKGGSGRGRNGE